MEGSKSPGRATLHFKGIPHHAADVCKLSLSVFNIGRRLESLFNLGSFTTARAQGDTMHRQRPPLRNGVDLQLQSAFYEGNWPVVARLAEKRARSFNDQYYEV
jgi:hypothetical protein